MVVCFVPVELLACGTARLAARDRSRQLTQGHRAVQTAALLRARSGLALIPVRSYWLRATLDSC